MERGLCVVETTQVPLDRVLQHFSPAIGALIPRPGKMSSRTHVWPRTRLAYIWLNCMKLVAGGSVRSSLQLRISLLNQSRIDARTVRLRRI